MRPTPIVGEYYHIYNRGTEKREIFASEEDRERFFLSMKSFNTLQPIGSIYEDQFLRKKGVEDRVSKREPEPLVEFVAYCLNPNHFHFILKQVDQHGIQNFMHRVGVGYTMYFNEKYGRTGGLFQGKYKIKHVDSNVYLLHLSAYVNLNFQVHNLGDPISKRWSSWTEYVSGTPLGFCKKEIVLNQFSSTSAYRDFCEKTLVDIKKDRENEGVFGQLLLE